MKIQPGGVQLFYANGWTDGWMDKWMHGWIDKELSMWPKIILCSVKYRSL